jgi:signal transduction histidine kinase
MPADLCPPLVPDELPFVSPSDERHARDELELVSLRATVSDLRERIQSRCEPPEVTETSQILSEQLRQANQHRALATFGDDLDRHAGEGAALRQTEFLSMLAHELRNPLQPIALANKMLAAAAQTDSTVAQAHGVMNRQIAHLVRLLDELLDAARAASGQIVLNLAPVGLTDVINAAVETSRPGILGRNQHLQILLPDTPITVTGDLIRLAQVFSNLLINASQFTHPYGNIVIAAQCHGNTVAITVSDDGRGIPIELQPFVFDIFTQGHRTLDRLPSGLGVGLSLVRTIIQMHDGSSSVSSLGLGQGSVFTITLPLAPGHPAARGDGAQSSGAARKILIIEDNADANEIMAMLLQMEGHEVVSCFDGVSGLRTALDGQFDIVLCDLSLPGLDGFQVVAALKAAGQSRPPGIIATTGFSDAEQHELARAAGFDHYLVKPLHLPTLYKLIDEYRA